MPTKHCPQCGDALDFAGAHTTPVVHHPMAAWVWVHYDPEDCTCDDRSWYGPYHDSACPLAGWPREEEEVNATTTDGK